MFEPKIRKENKLSINRKTYIQENNKPLYSMDVDLNDENIREESNSKADIDKVMQETLNKLKSLGFIRQK